jgi:hypothetical protein
MGRKKKTTGTRKKQKVKVIETSKPKKKVKTKVDKTAAGRTSAAAFEMTAPRPGKKGERPDWQRTHELVLFHSTKYLCKHLRFPSCRTLAELTGLHKDTCNRHIRDYDQERRKNKYSINLDAVTARLIKDVIETGDKGKAELLYKYVANWSERLSLEHSGRVDFRTARDKIDESKDNFDKTKAFVRYLSIQNDRRQFIGQN